MRSLLLFLGLGLCSALAEIPEKHSPASNLALFHFDGSLADVRGRSTATLPSGAALADGDGGTIGSTDQRFATGGHLQTHNQTVPIAGLLADLPPAGTVELWFKLTDAPSEIAETTLFCARYGGFNLIRARLSPASDGRLYVHFIKDGVSFNCRGFRSTWPVNVWTHLAVTWGPEGIKSYVDGTIDGWHLDFEYPNTAAPTVFELGSAYFDGGIDELRVLDRQADPEEIQASYWRAPYIPGATEIGKWSRPVTVFEPHAAWAPHLTIEPCVVDLGTRLVMVYTGWTVGAGSGCALGWAESVDGLTWTDHGQFLGRGAGGFTGSAGRGNTWHEDGTVYVYFDDGAGGFWAVTTTDFITFTAPVQLIDGATSPAWAEGNHFNTTIAKDAGTYHMIIEGGSWFAGRYKCGRATAPHPLGPWTVHEELADLQIANGIFGGGGLLPSRQADGYFHYWYHAGLDMPSPPAPNNILHARSADFKRWEILNGGNFALEMKGDSFSGGRADQYADPFLIEYGGKVLMFIDVDRNDGVSGVQGRIAVSTFNGTLAELLAASPFDRRARNPVTR